MKRYRNSVDSAFLISFCALTQAQERSLSVCGGFGRWRRSETFHLPRMVLAIAAVQGPIGFDTSPFFRSYIDTTHSLVFAISQAT
ncbi:hypothetical protein EBB79_12850 [Parasedimentitalea marina]|uniref:Uncharacterized protein n=1 Tax=Parasedimentitalea marina TaxID=2483033 RepID=A0A3T0N3S2_9RHOB|nr:hypothetical protein EBB79_12850 [Parasedimentitalea marina]